MENKKEPLMSAEEWYYNQLLKQSGKILSNFEIGQQYSNYVTQWHLNNVKEFVADEARVVWEQYGMDIRQTIDKQSSTPQ